MNVFSSVTFSWESRSIFDDLWLMVIEDLSKSQLGRYFKIENEPSNLQSNRSLKSIYLMKLFR